MEIVTYEEAKINELKRFFTGRKCKNDHIDEQLTSSRECMSCKREREARKYAADPTEHQQHYIKSRTKRLAQQKIADALRHDEKIEYGRKWREENREYAKKYRKENAGLYAYHAALRKMKVKQATPPWADLIQIRELYALAAHLTLLEKVPYEVDHIVPLVNELVCGLHVPANLRVITQDENRTKKNKFLDG